MKEDIYSSRLKLGDGTVSESEHYVRHAPEGYANTLIVGLWRSYGGNGNRLEISIPASEVLVFAESLEEIAGKIKDRLRERLGIS